MNGLNNHISTIVHTQRGDIPIEKINIGDVVYEYKSQKQLKVQGYAKSKVEQIYCIEYNDGRKTYVTLSDLIFTGKNIVKVKDKIIDKNIICYPIEQTPVIFSNNKVNDVLFPDPYIAGVLITYGDYDDKYINLPLDRISANQLFAHKYNLDYAGKLGKNKVYFRWNDIPTEPNIEAITWKEFFPRYDFYATSKNIIDDMIPIEYSQSSIQNRIQFIRGVFDIGYDLVMFPDSISIAHKHEFRLKEVQKILWSLGILSKVTYDPNLPSANERLYRLDVIGEYSRYPSLFYDINFIERVLENHYRIIYHDSTFQLNIESIYEFTNGYMTNLILDKQNAIYLVDNYLPKVSL